VTLYHGTTAKAAANITEQGLRSSKSGRWGKGVYFVDTKENAEKIAKYRARQRGEPDDWAVLECTVNLGDTERLSGDDTSVVTYSFKKVLSSTGIYDSTKGTHPPWAGVHHEFTEYCLKNHKKCNVVRKHVKNGSFIVIGGHDYQDWKKYIIVSISALTFATFVSFCVRAARARRP
jgi:hypothetical protein